MTDQVAGQSIWDGSVGSEEEERRKGARPYLEVLKELHEFLRPRKYLEIGIRHGDSLQLAQCDSIGVDPNPELRTELSKRVKVIKKTSDEFFESATEKGPFDLIFIDGMHLSEYVVRDFINAEKVASKNGVIVIDDVLPNHPYQAARRRRTQAWTGDVWKIAQILRQRRPDLTVTELDTFPTGLLLVHGLDPLNNTLQDRLDEILSGCKVEEEPGQKVLDRTEALNPTTAAVKEIVEPLARQTKRGFWARLGLG